MVSVYLDMYAMTARLISKNETRKSVAYWIRTWRQSFSSWHDKETAQAVVDAYLDSVGC